MSFFGGDSTRTENDLPDWLESGLKKASKLGQEAAEQPVPGYTSTFTPFDQFSTEAQNTIANRARAGTPLLGSTTNFLNTNLQGGLNAQQQGASTALGTYAQGAFNPAETAAANQLTATAQGDYLDRVNPYLQKQVDDNAAKLTAQLKSLYSGNGRYGSTPMVNSIADAVGRVQNDALAQNYQSERANQLAAAGQLGALGAGAANRGVGAAQSLGALGGQVVGGQLQAAGLLPTAQAAQYFDPQMLDLVGQARQANSQAQKQDVRAQNAYEYDANFLPAEKLAGLLTGVPAPMSTTQTTSQSPVSNVLGGALGGATLLGSSFGPLGLGIGALGGGLLGLL